MRSTSLFVILAALPAALGAQAAPAAQARRAPAAASRWTRIGATAAGNPVFIDRRSVRRENGIVTATVRATFNTPVRTPKGDVTSSRTIAMFDCAKRLVAVKENFLYHDERRGTVYEHRQPRVPGFGSVIRGTLPDVAMTHLCTTR